MLENSVFCCRSEQKCKVYELPTHHFWKRLYFLDECESCGQTVAILKECTDLGQVKTLKRYTGKTAIRLRDSLLLKHQIWGSPKTGSYSNELILFNNRGIVYNFNNRRVGTNEDFITQISFS